MKLAGAGLLFVSCAGVGFRIARDYRERPRQLRALMQSLRLLQAEVEYSVTPLPQALARVASRSVNPIAGLMEDVSANLRSGDITVAEAFDAALRTAKAGTAFLQGDIDVVQDFGETLGTTDRVHQEKHFVATLSELERLEREARESQVRNERLWQYLGVLTGLLLLILLY